MNELRQLATQSAMAAVAGTYLATIVPVRASESCASNMNCCYWPDGSLAGEYTNGTCCCVFECTVGTSGARQFLINGELKWFKLTTYSCSSVPDEC